MNRNTVITSVFVLATLGAMAVRFGLPAYAEYKVAQALDAHIAALPDPSQGTHAGLSLDYWNDRLELDRLQLPLDLPGVAGEPLAAVISIEGIVVDGYDFPALQAAVQTGAPLAGTLPLIDQVSWTGFTLRSRADDAQVGTGAAGRIDGVRGLTVDPATGAVTALAFDEMRQETLTARIPRNLADGVALTARIGQLSLTGVGPEGAEGFLVDGLSIAGTGTSAEKADATSVVASVNRITATGWAPATRDAAGTLETLLLNDIQLAVSLPKDPDVEAQWSGPVQVTMESYALADLRYDPHVLDIWKVSVSAWQSSAQRLVGKKPKPVWKAEHAEQLLTALERARSLDTGVGTASVTALKLTLDGKPMASVDRFGIRDAYGLKGGTFSLHGYAGTDARGTQVALDEYSITIGDFSGLPGWARSVFGKPITVDSMTSAATWAKARSVSELLPDFDMGTFLMKGMHLTTRDQPPVSIALLAIDRLRTTRTGDMSVAFRVEGIGMRVAASAGMPQVATALRMLEANGIKEINLDTGLSIQASLANGTGSATVRVAGGGLADMSLTTELTDVLFEYIRHVPQDKRGRAVTSSTVKTIRLALRDLGLRDLLLRGEASQRPGTTIDTIGAQFGAIAEQTGASMGTDAARAIGQQLAAFITQGGGLTLETGLSERVSIREIMELQRQPPAQIIDRLGITATHTAP